MNKMRETRKKVEKMKKKNKMKNKLIETTYVFNCSLYLLLMMIIIIINKMRDK